VIANASRIEGKANSTSITRMMPASIKRPKITGYQPQHGAGQCRDRDAEHADEQRRLRAIDDARQRVASSYSSVPSQ